MLLLALSLLPLLLGPLLVQGLQRVPVVIPALDGFVLFSVGGIALLHVLPDCVAHGGWLALAAGVVGLTLPFLLERGGEDTRSRKSIMILAVAGLAVHGLLDGVALAAGELAASQGILLSLGVLIHRVPSGVAIWWLARDRLGLAGAIMSVGTLGAASVVGFAASHHWHALFHGGFWFMLQALLFGALLHVLWHSPLSAAPHRRRTGERLPAAVGSVVGSALLLALGWVGGHHEEGLMGHIQEITPFVLLAITLTVTLVELARARAQDRSTQ